MTEWIKCSDRLPAYGVTVLIYDCYGDILSAKLSPDDDGTWDCIDSAIRYKPSHWMELPKPP